MFRKHLFLCVGNVSDLEGISVPNMTAGPRAWELFLSHGNACTQPQKGNSYERYFYVNKSLKSLKHLDLCFWDIGFGERLKLSLLVW